MIITPEIIQRAEIRENIPADANFKKAVWLEFMGAREFQWEPTKSLRTIREHLNSYKLSSLLVLGSEQRLWVFHNFSLEDAIKYTAILHDLRLNRVPLVERSNFNISLSQNRKVTDFWWDVQNHVMWSFNEKFMSALAGYLAKEDQ